MAFAEYAEIFDSTKFNYRNEKASGNFRWLFHDSLYLSLSSA